MILLVSSLIDYVNNESRGVGFVLGLLYYMLFLLLKVSSSGCWYWVEMVDMWLMIYCVVIVCVKLLLVTMRPVFSNRKLYPPRILLLFLRHIPHFVFSTILLVGASSLCVLKLDPNSTLKFLMKSNVISVIILCGMMVSKITPLSGNFLIHSTTNFTISITILLGIGFYGIELVTFLIHSFFILNLLSISGTYSLAGIVFSMGPPFISMTSHMGSNYKFVSIVITVKVLL